ncbi:DUF4870 domain-containing protein [Paenibacillus sp. WLX2291]|uniref:DUF4870 domain-containing protein n=1 Tax=Paenibacillus sp. WLX2291 TaxID=3296934 RepID=UPI0039840427
MSNYQDPYGQQGDPNDVQANKVMAILAYILFFVPLLAARNSPFAMYHANQGLVLFLVALAANILGMIIPFIGTILQFAISVFVLVLMIIGIINAANGERKPLPFIGTIQLIK